MELSEQAKAARNAYQRAYQRSNPEKVKEYQRRWREKNPEKAKAYIARYWERKAATPITIEAQAAIMRLNGQSYRSIAKELNISHMTAKRMLEPPGKK